MVARYRSLSIPAEPQMSQQLIVRIYIYNQSKDVGKDQDRRLCIVLKGTNI